MFIFGIFAFVDSEIRIRYRYRYRYRYRLNMSNIKSLSMSSTALEDREEIEKGIRRRRRNWIQANGNGRFLALVLVTPYLVCLIVGQVPYLLRIPFFPACQKKEKKEEKKTDSVLTNRARAASYGRHFVESP